MYLMIACWYLLHIRSTKILIVFLVKAALFASDARIFNSVLALSPVKIQSRSRAYTYTLLSGYSPSARPASNFSWRAVLLRFFLKSIVFCLLDIYTPSSSSSLLEIFFFLAEYGSLTTPSSISFSYKSCLEMIDVWLGNMNSSMSSPQGINWSIYI